MIHRRWTTKACANCPKKWWEHTPEEKESSGQCQWIDNFDRMCQATLPCPHHQGIAGGVYYRREAPPNTNNEFEELRRERGWPTPNHMRKAADALDMLVYPKYGDILRWVADQCDGKE